MTTVGPLGGSQRSSRRLFVLRALIVALVVTLLARLWFVQVASGSKYAAAANANGTRDVVTQAVRGLLLDDQGQPLVENRTALVVALDHTVLSRQKDGGTAVLQRLAPLVSTPQRPLTATDLADLVRPCDYKKIKPPTCNTGSPYQPVPVASFVVGVPGSTDTGSEDIEQITAKVARIQEDHADFPGVVVQTQAVQVYPQKDVAAQLLGYTDKVTADVLKDKNYKNVNQLDKVGRAGLEQQYDNALRGTDGTQTLSVDAAGNVLGTVATKAPVAGDDVVLNLDSKIQAAAQKALSDTINGIGKQYGATDGAAVVMTTDGRVLALASYPTFDANVFTNSLTDSEYQSLTSTKNGEPLLDRATDQIYSPGSTFKLITASALLKNNLINGTDTRACPSEVTIGNRPFGNFERESEGDLTLHQAIVVSCDTFFYPFGESQWKADGGYGQAGTGVDPTAKEVFPTMAKDYGLGKPTGIDLPNEAPGIVTTRASTVATWNQTKAQFCLGAKNYAKSDPTRAGDDAAYCTDGWRYNEGDLANFVIGQGGISVTPLQLANAYASLANGGTIYQPTIAKALVSPDGRTASTITPKAVGKLPLSAGQIDYLKSAFFGVTHEGGTGSGVFGTGIYPVDVSGKTGTAEVYDPTSKKYDITQSWFASYAPSNDPKYVVLVTIPHSDQGATVAAPAVKEIYNTIFGTSGDTVEPGKAVFGGTGQATKPPTLLPCFAPTTGVVSAPTSSCSASNPAPATVPPVTQKVSPSTSPSAAALGAAVPVLADPPPRSGLPTRSGGGMAP